MTNNQMIEENSNLKKHLNLRSLELDDLRKALAMADSLVNIKDIQTKQIKTALDKADEIIRLKDSEIHSLGAEIKRLKQTISNYALDKQMEDVWNKESWRNT